jgi:hypothetical protein
MIRARELQVGRLRVDASAREAWQVVHGKAALVAQTSNQSLTAHHEDDLRDQRPRADYR